MQYGDIVTVSTDGVRIREKELEPIGIFDGSRCWGIWVPDWRAHQHRHDNRLTHEHRPPSHNGNGIHTQDHEHLLISPFAPSSWPVLFRVECKLKEKPGTLASLIDILDRVGLNILSIEGTPSGFHHATVNIICEALPLKQDDDLLKPAQMIPDADRRFENQELWHYINTKFGPRMERFAAQVIDAIRAGSVTDAPPSTPTTGTDVHNTGSGMLYQGPSAGERPSALSPPVKGVHCTWLKNLAFFWLYGHGLNNPLPFRYHQQSCTLRPDASQRFTFFEKMRRYHPPVKTIASLNTHECYMRLVLSESTARNRTVFVSIDYQADFDHRHRSSIGHQKTLHRELATHGLSLCHISKAITEFTPTHEKGRIELLLHRPGTGQSATDDQLKAVSKVVQSVPEHVNCDMRYERVRVGRLGADKLFISTRFEWMNQYRSGVFKRLGRLARSYGFEPVYADINKLNGDGNGRSTHDGSAISSMVVDMIRHSSAFLQLIPQMPAKPSSNGHEWLLFEAGNAAALNLPMAVCVDADHESTLEAWKQTYKVYNDRQVHRFSGNRGDREILTTIRDALRVLANEIST